MTLVVLMVIDRLVGLRVGVRTETDGLDLSEHGEAIA
jgi:ammonia channel protein AmtB